MYVNLSKYSYGRLLEILDPLHLYINNVMYTQVLNIKMMQIQTKVAVIGISDF